MDAIEVFSINYDNKISQLDPARSMVMLLLFYGISVLQSAEAGQAKGPSAAATFIKMNKWQTICGVRLG